MDRARTELLELDDIYQDFPEFRLFKHRLPFATKAQTHRIIKRMARLARRQGECILWRGHCNNDGYPKMNHVVFGVHRSLYVHHLPFSLAKGREPRDFEEHSHACDTPACFNPEHVEAERKAHNRRRSAENTNRKKARDLKRGRRHAHGGASA